MRRAVMLTLNDFQRDVADIIETAADDAQIARRIRDLTRSALAEPDFVLDCIDRALSHFEEDPDRRPQPPLFVATAKTFAAHLVYWPADHRNIPHMHATWGVTGVFHNHVAVETFANVGSEAAPQLAPEGRFEAERGDAGYLLPSCIHRVCNDSNRASATLHLFAADDLKRPAECTTIWFGERSEEGMSKGLRPRAMEIFTEILAQSSLPKAMPLLERIFALSPKGLKLRIVKSIARTDLASSHRLSLRLESELDGDDRERLSAINRRVAEELAA